MTTDSIENKAAFLLSLRTGTNFTATCKYTGNDVKKVSIILNKNAAFKDDCQKALFGARVDILNMCSKYSKDLEVDKLQQARQTLQELPQLILWEQLCTRSEVTPAKLVSLYLVVKNVEDVATGTGFTEFEYMQYLQKHPAIMTMITSNSI